MYRAPQRFAPALLAAALLTAAAPAQTPAPLKATFEGVHSERKWLLGELNPALPADWSAYQFLALEVRTSSPQRFSLWVYDKAGRRRIMLQPFGQNVWLRMAIPLRFLQTLDRAGYDLASVNNRPAHSFWMSVWGPYGTLKAVESLGFAMDYPLGKPTLEIRSVQLAKEDPGSEFLEKLPVVDEFGQWAHADWPRKIHSLDQLQKEWAAEEKSFTPGEFGYCDYYGYRGTKAKATGFFRVERIDGRWWFVDPDGHLFLSMAVPNLGAGGAETPFEGRRQYYAALPPAGLPGFRAWNLFRRYGDDWRNQAAAMEARRVVGWGLTTGPAPTGSNTPRQPYYARIVTLPRGGNIASFLGMPDIYSAEFAHLLDQNASAQCGPRKDDPYLIGYFIGNEPPWPRRESELVDMFLTGPPTATKREIETYLEVSDTPERRRAFVEHMFEDYLAMVRAAMKKYDPNHLNLGIRFGGTPPEYLARMASAFDVYSMNTYEYEPVAQLDRAAALSGRPVLIGEFHFGVPADGLGAGLVQVRDQAERGVAYRYYVEQAAAQPAFVGAGWFIGVDESVTGRFDGENYNIGFVDVTDRPYLDLVGAARQTLKRLQSVHAGEEPPFRQHPQASEAGAPKSPWE
ncbi:MAG TPA: hypothetical protein VLW65_00915 [Bryobacteraceae bacterium]|nr:hypothetical protein [Bryobacteraceae bacterium]